MKYPDITLGRVEAVWNKLGGECGVQRFLSGELDLVEVKQKFERNEHGHILISITGLALTGKQEIQRLSDNGFRTSDHARSCLLSTKRDGYDKCHRLEDGREYKIALVPTKDVSRKRTTAQAREYVTAFGYEQLLAGGVPRLRETVSDKVMEEMGFWYIAALHDPVTDSDGYPDVLSANRHGGGQWVYAYWDHPGSQWADDGAFAFVVPAS